MSIAPISPSKKYKTVAELSAAIMKLSANSDILPLEEDDEAALDKKLEVLDNELNSIIRETEFSGGNLPEKLVGALLYSMQTSDDEAMQFSIPSSIIYRCIINWIRVIYKEGQEFFDAPISNVQETRFLGGQKCTRAELDMSYNGLDYVLLHKIYKCVHDKDLGRFPAKEIVDEFGHLEFHEPELLHKEMYDFIFGK